MKCELRLVGRPGSALILLGLLAGPLTAQDPIDRPVDLGGVIETPQDVTVAAVPDSILDRALARFNHPGTNRFYGSAVLPGTIEGTVGLFEGVARITGTVRGDVIVINGDLRLDASAVIEGNVLVLGGQLFPDHGARVTGSLLEFDGQATVRRAPDGLLVRSMPVQMLTRFTRSLSLQVGPALLVPRFRLGTYNRVEGLPVAIGAGVRWPVDSSLQVELDADLILRSARDPSGSRGAAGWWAGAQAIRSTGTRLTVGVEGWDRIESIGSLPLDPIEMALDALIAREDDLDWMGSSGISGFVRWQPTAGLTTQFEMGYASERSRAAVDAFSLLNSDEPWRPNPLIDDGNFTFFDIAAAWDTRDDPDRPRSGWFFLAGVHQRSSSELNAVVLPTQVRHPLGADGYGSWEARFDVRRALRLDPNQTVLLRLAGRGWIGGDPLTIQRRLAIGGPEPFIGEDFRAVACDPRRRSDPATPALCDRRLFAQAEYRRTVPLRLGTSIGGYGVGIEQADLVVFGGAGSAWLAGDGPGQVPAGRIQALDEWRSELGVGIDTGILGIYAAHAFSQDAAPVRFEFRFSHWF